jgi:serine/threonine-protein kinase
MKFFSALLLALTSVILTAATVEIVPTEFRNFKVNEEVTFKVTAYESKNKLLNSGTFQIKVRDCNRILIKTVDVDEAAKTVMITKADISQIKKESNRFVPLEEEEDEEDYEEDEEDDDDEEDDGPFSFFRRKKYDDEDDDDEDYDDDEEDDDDDYDDDEMDSRMEKIMTIGGIVAAIIILLIIVMLAGKILGFGLFKGKGETVEEPVQKEEVNEDTVTMIDILGMTYDEAKAKLNEMGVGIKSAGSEESDEYEEGQIMKQSVEKDTVIEKGTTVEVTIALEKVELVRIPDVKGESKEEAKYRLEQEGFLVDFAESYHDTVKEGKVIKTSPDVGTEQAKGTTVYITISKGKETRLTSVPAVVNTTRENAEIALKNAGLSAGNVTEEYSDTVAVGNVISQSVAGGTSVEEGVTVDLVISKGPSKVTMPEVLGRSKERAIEKLHAVGLSVEVYEEYSEQTVGFVVRSEPEEGSKLEPGSMVKIYLSKGPEESDSEDESSDDTDSSDENSDENSND